MDIHTRQFNNRYLDPLLDQLSKKKKKKKKKNFLLRNFNFHLLDFDTSEHLNMI